MRKNMGNAYLNKMIGCCDIFRDRNKGKEYFWSRERLKRRRRRR